MPRYKLRTLLVVLALGPPLLAGAWFGLEAYRKLKPSDAVVDWMTVTVPLIILEEEPSIGIDIPAKP